MDSIDLHVAGGDIEADRLKRLGLTSVVAWREALADGPVSAETNQLFDLRRHFVESAYGAAEGAYEPMVRHIFAELISHPSKRIHLHFNTDLFCAVNLMFLVTHLRRVPELVWTTPIEASPLSLLDRVFLHSCWHAYCGSDPRILEGLIDQAPMTMRAFVPSMRAHLERFPSTISGMSKPQEILSELIDRGIDDDEALISAFVTIDENRYGWGDAQIRREIAWTRMQRAGVDVRRDIGGCQISSSSPQWRWNPLRNVILGSDE